MFLGNKFKKVRTMIEAKEFFQAENRKFYGKNLKQYAKKRHLGR